MNKSMISGTATILAFALAVASSAQAGIHVYRTDFGGQDRLLSPGSMSWDVATRGGTGNLQFNLMGYDSIDGAGPYGGWYEDTFHLTVNGTEVFRGSFNMGGIGDDAIYLNLLGATVQTTNNGFFFGGMSVFNIPMNFSEGNQHLVFSYTGNQQIANDEEWGVHDATITVDEPQGFVLMSSVLVLLAWLTRRQTSSAGKSRALCG